MKAVQSAIWRNMSQFQSSSDGGCPILIKLSLLKVTPDQMIQAPGPLEMFTDLHDRYCLIVGQGNIFDIAREYPLSHIQQLFSSFE